jgi:hypothetical protein
MMNKTIHPAPRDLGSRKLFAAHLAISFRSGRPLSLQTVSMVGDGLHVADFNTIDKVLEPGMWYSKHMLQLGFKMAVLTQAHRWRNDQNQSAQLHGEDMKN